MKNQKEKYADKLYVKRLEQRILFLEGFTGAVAEPEKIKWYENIPEGGVLCWVSNNQDITAITHTFMDVKKYGNCNKTYLEAEPLTKQEIQVFMDNTPENV